MRITNENALRIATAMAQLDLRIGSHFCALTNPTDKDFADMRQLAINFDLPELAAQFRPQLSEVKPLAVELAEPETQFVVEIGGGGRKMSAESEYISFNATTGEFMRGGRNLIVNKDGVYQLIGWIFGTAKRNPDLATALEKFANDQFAGENNRKFFREMSEQFQPGAKNETL